MLRRWIWRDFSNILLGLWLIASPSTLGYRDATMIWSDVATGGLIVVLGILTLFPRFDLARWALCFTGIWLLCAPLVFWARDAGAYANDTLVGALVIASSVLIPMMPSRAHHEVMMGPGPDTPPGWRTFWAGGTLDAYRTAGPAESPATERWHHRSTAARIVAALDLNNVPWNLLASVGLGLWLMAAPAVLGVTGAAADSDHLMGALVVTWAVIAFGEIARPARLLNIPIGLWIVAAPWLLSGHTDASRWNGVLIGAVLVALSFRRRRIEERFGGWNRFLI